MTRYEFPSMVAKDPTQDITVKSAIGYVYAPGDTTFATPLATFDRYGSAKATIGCTSEGLTEEFYVDDRPVVWWKSAGYAFLISSHTGMLAATQLAQTAAQDAATAALLSKQAAETALSGMLEATDAGVTGLISDTTSSTRTALNALLAAVNMQGRTVDTNQDYKAILLSDGRVLAVPAGTAAPAVPANLAAVAGPTSARLSWNTSAGAVSYSVYRNGSRIAVTTNNVFRDTGPSGATFSYQVSATNSYSMTSALTAPLSVFMDPALNVAPSIAITTWPTTIPTTGSCIVRVNSTDANTQTVALTLNVDTGSLRPTRDPSVWILTL
jgi:hypothetical protein